MPMQTPQDLFIHELLDIRNAEQITIQMLEEAYHGVLATSSLSPKKMTAGSAVPKPVI
jgi:ferritin-like metal-binding protein YciE